MTEKRIPLFDQHRDEWYDDLKAYAGTLAGNANPHIIKLRQIVGRPARDYNLDHVLLEVLHLRDNQAFPQVPALVDQVTHLRHYGYPDEFIYKYDDSRRSGSATAAFFSAIRDALGANRPKVIESRD